jgi:hypothetical protein
VNRRYVKQPDGTTLVVRKAYAPRHYTVPATELARLAKIPPGYGSEEILDTYDGEFSSYRVAGRFERDGKRWALLVHPLEYAIEVELTRGQMGEIRPVAPEEAWRLAREADANEPRGRVVVEGEPGG